MIFFWIAIAGLAAAATLAVTRPLLREPGASSSGDASEADAAVYKDQLSEIESDRARGVLAEAEAAAARTEVARRLLRTAGPAEPPNAAPIRKFAKIGAMHTAATLAIPLASLALYLHLGAPGMPGQPLQARLEKSPAAASADDLVAKVEARLREAPGDGKGWNVIAPVYMAQGRFGDAADAYANANRLLGETPERLEGFAMASIRATNGLVNDYARKALARALAIDPKRQQLRIWLGLAKEQDGDLAGAVADYRALLSEAPAEANWRGAVEARIAEVEAQGSGNAAAQASPETPAELTPDVRAMAEKMVDGLAEKLRANAKDLKGWLMLIKSQKMLARDKDAASALSEARRQFAGDDKALSDIESLAKELGLGL